MDIFLPEKFAKRFEVIKKIKENKRAAIFKAIDLNKK